MAREPEILALCALLGSACANEAVPNTSSVLVSSHQPTERRPVDVLMVIDDSPSMHAHQASLAANLGAFAQVFTDESAQLDVRVAVVTTSVAGPTCTGSFAHDGELAIDGCASLPESAFVGPGELETSTLDQSDVREANCTLAAIDRRLSPIDELETDLALRPWFEPATNSYGGNLGEGLELFEVLSNVGLRGFGGCEFESPFAAARRALDRIQTPGDAAFGFLRTGAPLVIVFIGDEDDCSHPASSATIFDPAGERVFWSNPDATEATSAVCHNASTMCDEQSCEIVDRDLAGQTTSDPSAAVLDPVAGFVAALDELRTQREVAVMLVGGVETDGSLVWPAGDPLDPEDVAWREQFGWSPGCTAPNGIRAQPPARLHAAASAAIVEPLATSICTNDWTAALSPLSTGPEVLDPWCAPPDITLDDDCEMIVHTPLASTPMPSCERDQDGWVIDPATDLPQIPAGEDRCWLAQDDRSNTTEIPYDDISAECVDEGSALEWILFVRPGTLPLPRGSVYEVWCASES